MESDKERILKIAFACILPNVGGILGAFGTKKEVKSAWFKTLKQPWYRPPNWLFGPMWTTLYSSMGYASYLIYKEVGFTEKALLPLGMYATNLALNWVWSPLFFNYHKLGWAFFDITLIWGTIVGCIYFFHPISTTASYLMLPYLGWVSLATCLNYSIWKNNPQVEDKKSE